MKHEEKAAHGCKLFYCTRRKAYVCCSDCSLNPEYGGTCKDGRRARERQKMAVRWMREDADRRLLPKFKGVQ